MSQVPNSARHVIVSQESLTEDADAVLFSNVNVVNTMFAEHLGAEEISPSALRSYYVDFYSSQMAAGGFGHFAYASGMDDDVLAYIADGLKEMGAEEHHKLFSKFTMIFENLDDEVQEYFLNEADDDDDITDADVEDDYSDDDEEHDAEDASAYEAGRRLMDSDEELLSTEPDDDIEDLQDEEAGDPYADEFEDLDEMYDKLSEEHDLNAINAAWLKAHPDLKPVPDADIEEHVEALASEIPDIDERRRAYEAELEEGLEEHEAFIIELADVAEHDLEEILGYDPEFEFEGEQVGGWRFTTDEGEFVMIDNDRFAYMVDAETKQLIAELEFETEDEDSEAKDSDVKDADEKSASTEA